jgi:CubicO group peptidase (beta-lactamase class C family)
MTRSMMKSTTAVALCGSLFALALTGAESDPLPRATPQAVGLAPAKLQEATELLARFVAERKVAGAVAAVARQGKLVYLESVGFQDLETRAPMTDRSLFRIYSMAKAVTAVAVMMLHDEGRFRLDDPVAKYLPEFTQVRVGGESGGALRAPSRPVTVEDLLLHTSGLSHRTSELYREAKVRSRAIPLPQFIANIVRAPLMEDPGTRYRYSEGTTVLGRLVEVWSGQPFDVFLQARLLGPLKMSDTGFWVRPDERARLTTVYARSQGGELSAFEIEEVPFTERPALLEGAVGLVSTVPDYVRFAQMLLNKGELDGVRVLRASTVETITRNGLPDAVQKARGGPMGWGLANVNVVLDTAGLNYPAKVGEYGWDGSAGTIFWVDPTDQMVTVLMTQSSPANPDSLRQRFKTLVQQAITD